MKHNIVALFFFLKMALLTQAQTANPLQISFNNGLNSLSYNGVVLEDIGTFPADSFHIWHMKATDLQGNLLTGGQYSWGEVNNGRVWNANTLTWTYNYIWGSISVQFVPAVTKLDLNFTSVNSPNSGIIFDGAAVYPFVLHFPALPNGFKDPTYDQLAFNTTAPSVTLADFGDGEVASVYPNAVQPLYTGFLPDGTTNAYTAIVSGTALDNMPSFFPINDRPVSPGQTDSYTVSYRFAPSATALSNLASDAYQAWAAAWPPTLQWTDKRVIGTVYLASSPSGNPSVPAGYPNNPRRYFNDGNASDFDVRTPAGLAAFQDRILQQAAANVQNLQRLNAQGGITWDIEGEQYPQATSYVCEPDQIAAVAPEMMSSVSNSASPYKGMALADAYFKTMHDAGFRVGVCVRPQHFTLYSDGTANQVFLPSTQVAAELIRKIGFAHSRWGATLFYIDSSVDTTGAALSPDIMRQVASAFPDSLLIPEESTPKDYAYTAPFLTFIFHGDLSTPADVFNYYPNAFSANLINDANPNLLAQYEPQLTAAVKHGDILMAHADYWQANNPTIVQIYQAAGSSSSSPSPTPVSTPPPSATPPPTTTNPVQITNPSSGQTVSGQLTVEAQIQGTLDAAGSFLMLDGNEVGSTRVTAAPYNYLVDTTTVANGAHTLQIWAHNTNNQTLLSATINVTVANSQATTTPTTPATPAPPANYPISITYPANGATVTGTISVMGSISQTLDAAGSYLMVDGNRVGTVSVTSAPYAYALNSTNLTAGQHVLQIWAHDINNDTLLSNPVSVNVP